MISRRQSMRNIAIDTARHIMMSVVALLVLPLTVPAVAQDQMVLGPRQFARDTSADRGLRPAAAPR
jgi:hypothetical protein